MNDTKSEMNFNDQLILMKSIETVTKLNRAYADIDVKMSKLNLCLLNEQYASSEEVYDEMVILLEEIKKLTSLNNECNKQVCEFDPESYQYEAQRFGIEDFDFLRKSVTVQFASLSDKRIKQLQSYLAICRAGLDELKKINDTSE